jgi:hypothetical protein
MTRSFLALKEYKPLGACKGHLIIQSEDSSKEFGMDGLIKKGFFKELTDEESLKLYREQANRSV